MSKRPPLLLCVLDGFGEASKGPGNAISLAEPRFWNDLRQRYPSTLLSASGEDVGLPCGLMGNSEVGHMNLGAGRIVYQGKFVGCDGALVWACFRRWRAQ